MNPSMSTFTSLLILAVSLVCQANGYRGVDVSQLFSASTYTCMKNNGMHFAVIRAYRSFGGMDTNAVAGLKNAKSAGLITDIYMFPCRSKSATAQVDEMMAHVDGSLYGMVWIDVETNPTSSCTWTGHSYDSNCHFLADTISRIKAKGKKVGIYASKYMWQSIFGSFTACSSVASSPLWYAHYDKKQSFSDFTAFGGWTKPNVKQYQGDTSLCGANVDLNYYP